MIGVLVSGGLDSLITLRLMEATHAPGSVRGVWYDFGQAAAKREERALPAGVVQRRLSWLDDVTTYGGLIGRGYAERPFYLPGRNGLLMLAMICQDGLEVAAYGGLANEEGASDTDKNALFRALLSSLATYMLKRPVAVVAPLAERKWSKRDAIRWARQHGVSEDELRRTYSCYADVPAPWRGCGVCRQCLRRYLLFNSAGIVESEDDYQRDPLAGSAANDLARMLREDQHELAGLWPMERDWMETALTLGAQGELKVQLQKTLERIRA